MGHTDPRPSAATADRLQGLLANKGVSRCQVIETIVMLRKLVEIAKEGAYDKNVIYPLTFYLSIPLHAVMEGPHAKHFLSEIEPLLRAYKTYADGGEPVSQVITNKLGEMISFARFREALITFAAQHPRMQLVAQRFNGQYEWVAFIIGYVHVVTELPCILRLKSGQDVKIEASLEQSLVTERRQRLMQTR